MIFNFAEVNGKVGISLGIMTLTALSPDGFKIATNILRKFFQSFRAKTTSSSKFK